MQQISQPNGTPLAYDEKHWIPWNPNKWVVYHIGGRTRAAVVPFSIEKVMAKLRQLRDRPDRSQRTRVRAASRITLP